MDDNFYFLKNIDDELYDAIQDAQKLFRDEYFNQCVVQVRIFAEKMAKKISNEKPEGTFDNILNCLKDKIKTEREREFIEDLFFIKKEGNAAAHGEEILATRALEVIKRAFEASVNYCFSKTKDEKIDKLLFNTTLLITQKAQKEEKLAQKYLELAQKEEFLSEKQKDFESKTKKKTPTLVQQKIKEKIKKARKNLKQNINNPPKKLKKPEKPKKNKKKSRAQKTRSKMILFFIFVVASLIFLSKMLFLF